MYFLPPFVWSTFDSTQTKRYSPFGNTDPDFKSSEFGSNAIPKSAMP
jgi:hypothetical protein